MELKTYEGMFMLDPTKAAQEWDNMKKQIIGMIERRGGVIISARKWGERKLSYEIKSHKRAAYLLIYFQSPPENISILRRDLQLSEMVMRTLILAHSQSSVKEQQERLMKEQDLEQQEGQEKKESTEPTAPGTENVASEQKPQEKKDEETPKKE